MSSLILEQMALVFDGLFPGAVYATDEGAVQ